METQEQQQKQIRGFFPFDSPSLRVRMTDEDLKSKLRDLRKDYFAFLAVFFAAVFFGVDAPDAALRGGLALGVFDDGDPRKDAQFICGFSGDCAFFMARFATLSTIQSKLSWPTEWTSASGAGFMKSMA